MSFFTAYFVLYFHSGFDLGNPSALNIADFMNDFNHFLDIQFLCFFQRKFFCRAPCGVCNVPGGVDVYDDGLLLTALADAVLEIPTVFGVVAVQSEVESQIAASRFCIFREKFAERNAHGLGRLVVGRHGKLPVVDGDAVEIEAVRRNKGKLLCAGVESKTERQDGLFLCFSLRVMRNSEDDTAHHCNPNQKGHKHTEMFFCYVHIFNSPSIHKRIVSKANTAAMATRFRFMGKPLLRCTSIRSFDLRIFHRPYSRFYE